MRKYEVMMKCRLKIVLVLLILPFIGRAQQPAGTLNVKTDGTAVGNGIVDDAAAIQDRGRSI